MTISTEPNILRNKRRSSHRRYSIKKRVLENFANFTGIHWNRCICVNCENFQEHHLFTEHLQVTVSVNGNKRSFNWKFVSDQNNSN